MELKIKHKKLKGRARVTHKSQKILFKPPPAPNWVRRPPPATTTGANDGFGPPVPGSSHPLGRKQFLEGKRTSSDSQVARYGTARGGRVSPGFQVPGEGWASHLSPCCVRSSSPTPTPAERGGRKMTVLPFKCGTPWRVSGPGGQCPRAWGPGSAVTPRSGDRRQHCRARGPAGHPVPCAVAPLAFAVPEGRTRTEAIWRSKVQETVKAGRPSNATSSDTARASVSAMTVSPNSGGTSLGAAALRIIIARVL